MKLLENEFELSQVEEILNYMASEYYLPKNKVWRTAGLKDSQHALQVERSKMDEYPWIEWRSLWEWFDRIDTWNGKSFASYLLESETAIPYPDVYYKLLNSRIGVYLVIGIQHTYEMTLKDLVTHEVYRVKIEADDLHLPWTVLIGRLFPLGPNLWTGIQEWISFPPYYQIVMQECINEMKLRQKGELSFESVLKQEGLTLIHGALNPTKYTEEEFLLIMEQFQEILMEDRGLFDRNIELLPHDTQVLIYQTLYYTIWLSALSTDTSSIYFPWESQLEKLGVKGNFRWTEEIHQQLKKNHLDAETDQESV